MSLETISEQRNFAGVQGCYRHESAECAGAMRFSVFQPPQAALGRVPVLYFLAGLTCNEETFMIKAGAQRVAAELGLMLVAPDTSPRSTGAAGATVDWQFGEGAGFYLDASQEPFARNFRMYSYVARELPALIEQHFPADISRSGISGHSMGGHGALTIALKNPGRYRSVSAFAPIVAASQVPWGQRALAGYLGPDQECWAEHDACQLLRQHRFAGPILIDQGSADQFLDEQLRPQLFQQACARSGQELILQLHPGYDHSYWFVSSFIEAHLRHHARALV